MAIFYILAPQLRIGGSHYMACRMSIRAYANITDVWLYYTLLYFGSSNARYLHSN